MPDPSILKLRTSAFAFAAKTAVWNSFTELLKAANIREDQASICSPPAGRSFEVRFKGGSAAINAIRTVSTQNRDGEWTKLQCPAANGTEDANIFVSPNENPKTERNESLLRQLREAVLTLHPSLQGKLRVARSDGILPVGSDPVASVLSPEPGEV